MSVIDLDLITKIVAVLGAFSTVFFAVQQLRNLNRNRQATLFMQLYERFYNPAFWKQYSDIIYRSKWDSYEDFWDKYGPQHPDAFADWMSFGTYFSGIGVLLKRGMIDVSLVEDLIGDFVIWIWRKWEPLFGRFDDERKPHSIEWFEYLYKEIEKERKRKRRLKK